MKNSTLTIYEPAAIPALAPDIAKQINALHDDVQRLEKQSREKLNNAVTAAWQAGKLLVEAKASVVRYGGRGAWLPWLKTTFHGGIRTAQRYMKLAHELPHAPAPTDMSLRQLYFRLGIATEPKQIVLKTHIGELPSYLFLANRLLRVLRGSRQKIQAQDLAALYQQLQRIFEANK